MFKLVPTNTKFYDLFDRSSEILVKAAERLLEFFDKPEHGERCAGEIKALEHEADEVTHESMELLHRSFITPIERGDIRELTEKLDDVLDLLDDASRRIVLYEIKSVFPEVRDLARVLLEATRVVKQAVGQLRNLQKKNDIIQCCIEIRRLENEGDQINHEILAKLFKSNQDPLTVLKWKEIIVDVESAIDSCQDVANVLEGIVLENT
jgi:predicted phosphate transport protein (TIGR00153 family)